MIPVVWHAQQEGRGIYNSTAMLNDLFDAYHCEHFPGNPYKADLDGAVVVVHGGRELEDIDRLNEDIAKMSWVLLIALGDEESRFPIEKAEHSNKRVWIQEPLPGKHDFSDRYLINGYPHDYRRHLVKCDREFDWVFAAQVTHERRRACARALENMWNGVVLESRGYCKGIAPAEYYRLFCRAKIIPCPSGPHSPDSARPWESLECGAIPILDDLSPTRKEPGFWKYVLGDHPLPVVTDWSTLPDVIEELKRNWDQRSADCQSWWESYKRDFRCWILKDIEQLTGAPCTRN